MRNLQTRLCVRPVGGSPQSQGNSCRSDTHWAHCFTPFLLSGYIGKRQPGSAMFKFGRNFGFLLGALQALRVRVELIRPQRWQKGLALGTASACRSPTVWKNKLKAHAQRLYPHLKVTLKTADALLLLDYALRQPQQENQKQKGPRA